MKESLGDKNLRISDPMPPSFEVSPRNQHFYPSTLPVDSDESGS